MKQAAELIFSHNGMDLAGRLKEYAAVFIISDCKVRDMITERLVELCIESGVAVRAVRYIPAKEKLKTLKTVEKLHKWLLGVGADRNSLVLNVGGGIISDIGGFAASTFMRGIRYANVPTTLLAQVDASIGGKTGVNVGGYKNIAGLICQPVFTYINSDYLRSLDWADLTAGYAELLKTFIIGDATAYEDAVNEENPDALGRFVEEAASIKMRIVQSDLMDRGERRVLNLGHTFAHAIEYMSAHTLLRRALPCEKSFMGLTAKRVSHGHAVAMGIVMAAQMSENQAVALTPIADRIKSDFEKVGLPVESPWSVEQLKRVISRDKKSEDGTVHFVLIRALGDVVVI